MIKNNIINILTESDFSSEFITYVYDNFPKNYKKMFNKPYHMHYLKNPINDLKPSQRLFESLAQLIPLKAYYVTKGIPLSYLYQNVQDLSFRLERYYEEHGTYGISTRDVRWVSPLYEAKIFELGTLRFEIEYFSNQEVERSSFRYMPLDQKWKERFPEGTPLISIHILKDKDFSPNSIDKSLDMANEFFGKYFPEHDYEIFFSRTWLLYEPTRSILDESSNIVSFSKRFKIIAENQNTKQALDRIYGTNDLEVIAQMDKESSLAKVAYKNLDKLGVAAGVIYK